MCANTVYLITSRLSYLSKSGDNEREQLEQKLQYLDKLFHDCRIFEWWGFFLA